MFKEIIKWFIMLLYQPLCFTKCKLYSYIPRKCIGGQYIIIGHNVKISDTKIGSYTFINDAVQIDANTKEIGRYCSISAGVKIGLGPHPLSYISTSPAFYSKYRGFVTENIFDEYKEKGYTYISDDVWIGANAIIMAGITVGRGAIIGAGAIVTHDIPPFSIVVGNPGRVIRYRFDLDTIEMIEKSKWWEKEISELMTIHSNWSEDIRNPKRFYEF